MPTAETSVSVRLLYPFGAALCDEGVDLDVVLSNAEISRATYQKRESRIPVASARRFHFAAAASSRDPALGLAAARHFAQAQFQILEYFAATSTDVGAAVETLVKSESVLSNAKAIKLEPRAEGVLVRVEPVAGRWHRCFVEFAVGAIYLAGRRILGMPLASPRQIIPWFAFSPPVCVRTYEDFFGVSPRLDAPASGLLIPGVVLRERLGSMDAQLHSVLEKYLSDLALEAAPAASLLDRARALLHKSLPEGDSCLAAIAAKLHMSPRTFRRRLSQDGVTYRSLLQELRQELTFNYLNEQDITLDDIAYRIGYDDAASFHKAFKRWTGTTPAEYRARTHPCANGVKRPRH